jgi:hypothetical protein
MLREIRDVLEEVDYNYDEPPSPKKVMGFSNNKGRKIS